MSVSLTTSLYGFPIDLDYQRENWGKFLFEVLQELVYNVAYQFRAHGIRSTRLRRKFKERFFCDPIDFFHWRYFYKHCEYWFELVERTPGLDGLGNIVKIRHNSPNVAPFTYNRTQLTTKGTEAFENTSWGSVATYRECLLLSACKLVTKSDNEIDVDEVDKQGNTALHLVASLPGNSSTLLEYLLNAGFDLLKVNLVGLNAVHIIAGRIMNSRSLLGIDKGLRRIAATSWAFDDRKESLCKLLENTSALVNNGGRHNNTGVHECIFSTQTIKLVGDGAHLTQEFSSIEKEIMIAVTLTEFGARLGKQNDHGLAPLHFAFNSKVFSSLVTRGADCEQTSRLRETPFLYLLKYFVDLAVVHAHSDTAIETEEIRSVLDDKLLKYSELFVKQSPIRKATFVLNQLRQLTVMPCVSSAVRRTVWIPDVTRISPLKVLLMLARIACYYPNPANSTSGRKYSVRGKGWDEMWRQLEALNEFENALVKCVQAVVLIGNKAELTGKQFVHLLLDVGKSSSIKLISRMTSIERCLSILIRNGADTNAQNDQRQTPLHLISENYHKCPEMFQRCAQVLTDAGIRLDLRDNHGVSVKESLLQYTQLQTIVPQLNVIRKIRSSSHRHSHHLNLLTTNATKATVVENYRFMSDKPIGQGADSNIYVAIKDEFVEKESGTIRCREFALKRLEKSRIVREEVEREVNSLLKISTRCENIVDYYETMEDENFSYIVLELMECDLREFVVNEEVSKMLLRPGVAQQVAVDVVKGVSFLHENKFLHRDLKPGNILYKHEPRLCLKIADFGLAKDTSSSSTLLSTRAGAARHAGTKCWKAPELVSLISSEHTKESDVFALGLVLHYLLSLGKHPFVDGTLRLPPEYRIEANIAEGKMLLDSSLSHEAKHLVKTLLNKDSRRRPPASSIRQHPFFWSEKKKVDFLKAVGDQKEAALPREYPDSDLQRCLQHTELCGRPEKWNNRIPGLYSWITRHHPGKEYRTDQVIDLIRFARNVYTHKEEHPEPIKHQIDILLKKFPTLVLEVYMALNKEGFLDDARRTRIQDALKIG